MNRKQLEIRILVGIFLMANLVLVYLLPPQSWAVPEEKEFPFANEKDKVDTPLVLEKSKNAFNEEWQDAKTWAIYLNGLWKPKVPYNMGTYSLESYWDSAEIEKCTSKSFANYICEISIYKVDDYSVDTRNRTNLVVSYRLEKEEVRELKIIRSPLQELEHRINPLNPG